MKQIPAFEAKNVHITYNFFAQEAVAGQIHILPPGTDTPAFGEYWPGEGGINGGYVPAHGQVPEHYLIFAAKDAGRYVWGRHGETSKATDKRDGLANTAILLAEGDHLAAKAAAEYTADGHTDFYLGATAEMYQGWLNCPDKFDQDVYYYTSTQFSADYAYYMGFSDGSQYCGNKGHERSVRPVRRFECCTLPVRGSG